MEQLTSEPTAAHRMAILRDHLGTCIACHKVLDDLLADHARLVTQLAEANAKVNFLVKEVEDEDDPNA